MANQNENSGVHAAQERARLASNRADFLEARADLFEGAGPHHDDGNLLIWEMATPTKRSTP